MRSFERWTYHDFVLAMGSKAFKGGSAAIDLATGKVKPAAASGTLLVVGIFGASADAGAADTLVQVNLCREIEVEWWANGGGITPAMVGKFAYVADDQTVSNTGTVLAGRIWAVDTLNGVAVELILPPPTAAPAAAESEPESEPAPEPVPEEA